MAEFPNLGNHCAVESCNTLDFLPFQCDLCSKTYCLTHRRSSDHQCPSLHVSHAVKDISPAITTLKQCSLVCCKNRELVVVVCEHCNADYCLSHRHQQDHDCNALCPKGNVESKVSILVNTIIESKKHTGQGERRRPLNHKLNLMKMKMAAIGDKGLPEDERIYLATQYTTQYHCADDVPVQTGNYFFSKKWTVGRVIDQVSATEKLKNCNNISTAEKLLAFTSDSKEPLPVHSSLEELILSNAIHNGCSVTFRYTTV